MIRPTLGWIIVRVMNTPDKDLLPQSVIHSGTAKARCIDAAEAAQVSIYPEPRRARDDIQNAKLNRPHAAFELRACEVEMRILPE